MTKSVKRPSQKIELGLDKPLEDDDASSEDSFEDYIESDLGLEPEDYSKGNSVLPSVNPLD